MPEIRPEYLEGKKVGVVAGSAHEAYLKAMFTDAELHPIPTTTPCAAPCARARSISSSATPSRWRSGSTAPIPAIAAPSPAAPSSRAAIFGEGIGIAVRKGNDVLRQALNWAMFRVWEKGRYTDLWLRYFSVSPFYRPLPPRHCEERSDEAIQSASAEDSRIASLRSQ